MFYKYQKIVTTGATGTIIAHQSTEENPIEMLGIIDDHIYIKADDLTNQNESLDFVEITLNEEEKKELLSQKYLKTSKADARLDIRREKDIEDDLTDQKILIQFMARGFAGLWQSLPKDIKDNNPYKENFDRFSNMILDANVRIDKEVDQVARVAGIIQDEAMFADIVEEKYLSKI